jgi:hypothetical protein
VTSPASAKIVALRQFCPGTDGCLALIEMTDIDTGAITRRLQPLTSRGTPDPGAGPDAFGPSATGSYAGFALAAAALPALRAVAPLLVRLLPPDVTEIATDGRDLFLLEDDHARLDGTAQRLHRFEIGQDGWFRALPAPDLAPLALAPHRVITGLALTGSGLVVAVADPLAGFDVFHLPRDPAKGVFSPLLAAGARRFMLNATIASFGAVSGGLLLGTAALAEATLRIGNWGPELLLLPEQGPADLIVGQPRTGTDDLMLPAAGMLPGLGRAGNAAIRAIATIQRRDGRSLTCIAVQDHAAAPVARRAEARPDLLDYSGEVRFYAATDLTDWKLLPARLPAGIGAVCALAVTAEGLLVGHEGLGAATLPVSFVSLA